MKRHLKLRASLWDRFHDKISPEPNSGCWLWLGGINESGYGIIGMGRRHEGVDKAHRVAYRLYKGDPAGKCVCHRCDNPACVNPDHLFLGTLADNMRDCVAKGRNFTPDNRGERSTGARLTSADVHDIRARRMLGRAYAAHYGVSKSTIYKIWAGDNWASV